MINNVKPTFIVQILNCRNAAWQGRITWLEAKKTQNFRSALEMIRLIDSIICSNADKKMKGEDKK